MPGFGKRARLFGVPLKLNNLKNNFLRKKEDHFIFKNNFFEVIVLIGDVKKSCPFFENGGKKHFRGAQFVIFKNVI